MPRLSEELIKKIAHMLEEEETDIYVLTLYFLNSKDMEYFDKKDATRIRQIMKVLIEDTHRHAELLKLVVELGSV